MIRQTKTFSRMLTRAAVFAPLLAAALPAAAAPPPAEKRPENVEVRRDVPFRTVTTGVGKAELALDVYVPGGGGTGPRPAVLWIHGGGFRPGNDRTQKYIVSLSTEYARRGFVAVAPDYRVRTDPKADPTGTLRDAVEDGRAALAWMRGEGMAYGIDPDRIVVGGGSAGGMVAESLVALENAEASHAGRAGVAALVVLWGSPEADYRLAPIDSSHPPTVLVHGTQDRLVPFRRSEELAAALKLKGIPVLLHPLPGAGHTPSDRMDEIVRVTAAFIDSALARKVPAAAALVVEVARRPGEPWTAYPTRTLDQLPAAVTAKPDEGLCPYGGLLSRPAQATGFFRTEKVEGRWWLVDPDGHLVVARGVTSVNMLRTPGAEQALRERFGSEAGWAEATTATLRESGFNGTGSWSDVERLRAVGKPLAYTRIWNFMSSYGRKRGGTYQQAGHTGYPNDTIFVFDPDFEAFCDEHAKALAASKDDPWLLGHFSDNELPFKLSALKSYLSLPEGDPGRVAAEDWLKARRGPNATAARVSDEDEQDFLFVVAERYFRIVSAAMRKYDPNHLYLGPRLHGNALRMPEVFRAARAHVDVVAVNWYRTWTPDAERLAMWERESGRPSIITEWYAKGADSGLGNTSGAGWLVKTQEDRARFYQNFTLGLLESRVCVGWHWFRYADNDPADTKADPSNTDANKGIVTNRYQPYQPLLDAMKRLNERVYGLISWMDRSAQGKP